MYITWVQIMIFFHHPFIDCLDQLSNLFISAYFHIFFISRAICFMLKMFTSTLVVTGQTCTLHYISQDSMVLKLLHKLTVLSVCTEHYHLSLWVVCNMNIKPEHACSNFQSFYSIILRHCIYYLYEECNNPTEWLIIYFIT